MAANRTVSGPSVLQQKLEISVYVVQQVEYPSLQLLNVTYPHWIASHVLEGEVETVTDGNRLTAGAGDVMIHPPYTPFSETAKGRGIHQWFGFDAALSPNLELFRFYPVSLVIPLAAPPMYSELFRHLLSVWEGSVSPLRDVLVPGYLSALLGFILDGWQQGGGNPRSVVPLSSQDRLNELIRFMRDHLHDKLNRSILARKLHLNPNYMDRLFQETYGVTPMHLLRDMRLRRVRQLLESSEDTLSSIAQSCGLGDAAYLSRSFVDKFGQTPGEYREHARKLKSSYMNGE